MVRHANPPLSPDELERATNAAAAIVTRCNMVSTDGFVAAAKLFAMLERKMMRTSVLDFNVVDICAVLAHTTI